MKRQLLIALLAVVVALLLLPAASAAAKKGGNKPPPEPAVLYEVTLGINGAGDGLGTCVGEGSLTMAEVDGHLMADGTSGTSMPRIYLRAEVPADREFGYVADNAEGTFDGCHGGPLPGSESSVPSYFYVYADADGNVNGMLWAFDVYVELGTKGKNRTPGVKEYFRLWSTVGTAADPEGNPCPIAAAAGATCLVQGLFEVWHYYPIEQVGEAYFDFTLTITPVA